MKPQTIRFSDRTWNLISREASEAGITTAQFVREAAVAYAYLSMGERGGEEAEAMRDLLQSTRRLLRAIGEERAADPQPAAEEAPSQRRQRVA